MSTKTETTKDTTKQAITIAPPNFETVSFLIEGTAPYVQNRFSAKAMEAIRETQEAGSTAKKGKRKEAKDFGAAYLGAMHVSTDGWCGIPAPAFRNAMISACKIVGFHMTKGKLSVFVEADGFDEVDGTPLVKIAKGEPHYHEAFVRNASGVVDLRPRPMWDPGWQANVRVRYDADMFALMDVTNLMLRAGMQVGIGEGRPDSKSSCGQGWGVFSLKGDE